MINMRAWFELRFLEHEGKVRVQIRLEEMGNGWLDIGGPLPTRRTAGLVFGLITQVMEDRYDRDPARQPCRFEVKNNALPWPTRIRPVVIDHDHLVQVVYGFAGSNKFGEQSFATAEAAEAARQVIDAALQAITGGNRTSTRAFVTPSLGSGRGGTISVPPPLFAEAAPQDLGIPLNSRDFDK